MYMLNYIVFFFCLFLLVSYLLSCFLIQHTHQQQQVKNLGKVGTSFLFGKTGNINNTEYMQN